MKRIFGFILLLCSAQTLANTPIFDWGPPPKVMGCGIAGTYSQVTNCLNNKVNKQVNDAVNAARATHQNVIANLNAQHDAAMGQLQNQLTQLQSELEAAQQAAQSSGQQMARQVGRQTQRATDGINGTLQQMSGPLLELQTCLARRGVNLEELLLTQGSESVRASQARVQALWRDVFRNARSYPRMQVDPQNPPNINQMVNQAEAYAGRVANSDPIAGCLWNQTQPLRAQAKQAVITIFPSILAEFNRAVKDVAEPMAQQAMRDLIQPLLRDAVGLAARTGGSVSHAAARQAMSSLPEDVRRQIFGLAHERILNSAEMNALIASLNNHSTNVTRGDTRRSLAEVRAKIELVRQFTDEEAVLVGVDVLRVLGHEQIDSPDAQAALAHGIGMVLTLGNGVDGVVNAITGTASQPTTAISNFIVFCVEFGLNAHISVAQWGITQASHVAWEQTMVAARRAMGSRGRAPSRQVRQALGPFGDLLRHFPTEADLIVYTSPQLEMMRRDLLNYHTAVLKLAEIAGGQTTAQRPVKSATTKTVANRQKTTQQRNSVQRTTTRKTTKPPEKR